MNVPPLPVAHRPCPRRSGPVPRSLREAPPGLGPAVNAVLLCVGIAFALAVPLTLWLMALNR